ncbi:MAG: ABC transporter permease [Boseongicola sp. SB0664_bin_43]|uniref:ABC transporter permease n=1 Tax=Boseongicola sp. SB0664_bin_43 TaxID=2604844 RepID=A0A6B0Y130_9RHOB|nr:ABC transporter permease [Boseongicola sp. SB0664_bin_43]MYK30775.1 ABC transporter permease [Boseongicola sp. SB0670_bin_30]
MQQIARIIALRLAIGALTLVVISLIVFFSLELMPGDVAQAILGQAATPETVAALREKLGLTLPPWERYLNWLAGVLQGDFGDSLANKRPILGLIASRLGNTVFLACYAAAIAVPTALALGILAALYRNTSFDRSANVVTLSFISFPDFFVGYLLVFLLAKTGLFPSLANIPPDISLGETLYRTFLPALTLTLVVTAHMMRMTRAAIINLLASDFIEMARLKGLTPRVIILVHALPNALSPIINVVALNLAYLITGVVVVEVVFAYPGLGQLMVDSVSKRDIPVVQAISLIFAAAYVLLNLTADILSMLSNPRIMHPRQS